MVNDCPSATGGSLTEAVEAEREWDRAPPTRTSASEDDPVHDPRHYETNLIRQFCRYVHRRAEQVALSRTRTSIPFLESQNPGVAVFLLSSRDAIPNKTARKVLDNPFFRSQVQGEHYRPRPAIERLPSAPASAVHAPSLVYHMAVDHENLRRLGLVTDSNILTQ